jgi:hypothetical protein
VDKNRIKERLKTDAIDIGYSTNFWATNIPERQMRFIVALIINGDGVASRTCTISKVREDGTLEAKFKNIPVAPADVRQIPEGAYDIENPVLVLEGGTNLHGSVVGGTLYGTVIYYDWEAW